MRKMYSISQFAANGHEAFEEWLVSYNNGLPIWSSNVDDALTFDADSEEDEVKAIVAALEQVTPAGIDVSANTFFRMETRFH